MSLRTVIQAFGALTKTFNQLGCDQRDLFRKGVEKFTDLTNNEIWWTKLQALAVGATAVASGAAGIASSLIPKGSASTDPATTAAGDLNVRLQQNALPSSEGFGFPPDMLRAGLKVISKVGPQVGEAARIFMQGPILSAQSKKMLAERVEIPNAQQVRGDMDRERQQMADAIARMQQAKARAG
jgi:hypothetical protein